MTYPAHQTGAVLNKLNHLLNGLILIFILSPKVGYAASASETDTPVKFGFTRAMFVDLNEGDTRAAVKSYASLLTSNSDLIVSDSPGVLDGAPAVTKAFANGEADVISLTTTEYLALPNSSTYPRLIVASMGHSYFEQYVLLVRSDSNISTISDLQNKRLLVYSSLRGSLSPLWLDVLLASNNLEEARYFFASVTMVNKPSRTVLPVFFRQADACIVTKTGYEVMGELNPQVLNQLKIIAHSPAVIPTVTCFRAGIAPRSFEQILKAVVNAQHTTSGRQVLTIFQCDGIAEINRDQIDSVRELIADQARLRRRNAVTNNSAPTKELINTAKTQ